MKKRVVCITVLLLFCAASVLYSQLSFGPAESCTPRGSPATFTGTLTVNSPALVANLNADLLDGCNVGTTGPALGRLDTWNMWTARQDHGAPLVFLPDGMHDIEGVRHMEGEECYYKFQGFFGFTEADQIDDATVSIRQKLGDYLLRARGLDNSPVFSIGGSNSGEDLLIEFGDIPQKGLGGKVSLDFANGLFVIDGLTPAFATSPDPPPLASATGSLRVKVGNTYYSIALHPEN